MEHVDEPSEAIPRSGRAWSDGNRGMLKIALSLGHRANVLTIKKLDFRVRIAYIYFSSLPCH
jgi:hypothetical protein